MANENNETIGSISAASARQQPRELEIQETSAPSAYAVTVRVSGSAEEINLDFGGAVRLTPDNKALFKIDQRIILSPFGAKRLLMALHTAMARYEQTYGVVEVDETKRRLPTAPR